MPTYKYIKMENTYDLKRVPSWCDRILYYRRDKAKLKVLSYASADLVESDHKPVYGVFRIKCKKERVKEKSELIHAYYSS
jgi:inositol-1,4,5-trisphosphate 5-phosphatase